MAQQNSEVNKSEEIRTLLKANPKITAKEAVETLAKRDISVTASLFYFIKGREVGRSDDRRRQARQAAAKPAAAPTGEVDTLKTILKVKGFALELGGLKRLKALVDALSE